MKKRHVIVAFFAIVFVASSLMMIFQSVKADSFAANISAISASRNRINSSSLSDSRDLSRVLSKPTLNSSISTLLTSFKSQSEGASSVVLYVQSQKGITAFNLKDEDSEWQLNVPNTTIGSGTATAYVAANYTENLSLQSESISISIPEVETAVPVPTESNTDRTIVNSTTPDSGTDTGTISTDGSAISSTGTRSTSPVDDNLPATESSANTEGSSLSAASSSTTRSSLNSASSSTNTVSTESVRPNKSNESSSTSSSTLGSSSGTKQPSPEASDAARTSSQASASPSTPETVIPSRDAGVSTPNEAVLEAVSAIPETLARTLPEVKNVRILAQEKSGLAKIDTVKNTEISTAVADQPDKVEKKNAILFSGKTTPNSTVYLYIFSDPIIVSVKADENGNWQYVLDRPLDTGKHESYVLVQDPETQEMIRTEAKTFYIAEARASSNLLDLNGEKSLVVSDPFNALFTKYIIYILFLVAVAALTLLTFGLMKLRKAKANEAATDRENQ